MKKGTLTKQWGNIANIVFALLMVLIVSSCQENEVADLNPKKQIQEQTNVKELKFIGQWLTEGKRGDLVKDFTRQYEFRNQHLRVVLKFPEEIMDNYSDRTSNVKFVSDLVDQPKPDWDIIRINNQINAIGIYRNDKDWAKKHLVDFSQIPEFRQTTKAKLLTDEVKAQWGGIIPGPMLEGNYWALWFNKNVEQKLGITIKRKGMTVDDFLSYMRSVNQYNQNHPDDYIVPMHEAGDWRTSFALVFQIFASALNNNDQLFSKEFTDEKLQAWHKTLKVLEELSAMNALAKNWSSVSWSESTSDVIDEKCLFYSNGSWMYNIWEQANPDGVNNIVPCEYPVFNPISMYPSSYFAVWGVLKNSPNRDEAVDFLLAMNSADMANMWVQYTKCPTGIKSSLSDALFGSDPFEDFSTYIQKHYGDNIYNFGDDLCVYVLGNNNMNQNHYRDVLEGRMIADEAMLLIRSRLLMNNHLNY